MKRCIAKLIAPRKFEFFEEEIPALADHEMLVKIRYVGLCHSDLPSYQGRGCTQVNKNGYDAMTEVIPYPLALGHEPLGVVAAVGKKITAFQEGDAVSGMFFNAFSTYAVATEDNAVKVTSDPGRCCLAEPLMCISNIARIACPEFGDSVAVIGCGFMGLLTIMALKSQNIQELTAIDVRDDRLEMAKKYGATKTINPLLEDLEDAAFKYSGGKMFDVAVEISGSLRGLDSALAIIRLADRIGFKGRGKILLPSVYGKEETWSLRTGWNLMLKAPIIHVAHPRYCLDIHDTMERGVSMYNRGILKLDELISHRIPFAEIDRGFNIMENNVPGYMKGVVVFPN